MNEWDERYGETDEPLWSGKANGVLVQELKGLRPGRALDVGCGEGGDSIWLAGQGWQVTGIDVSAVAIERAREAAKAADVTVDWVCADFMTVEPLPAFDLVSVHYLSLRNVPKNPAVRALTTSTAPGGTLLTVGHWPLDPGGFSLHA